MQLRLLRNIENLDGHSLSKNGYDHDQPMTQETIGSRLLRARERAGVTGEALMQRTGIAKSTIHAMETGRTAVKWEWKRHRDRVAKIAEALDISPDEIWKGIGGLTEDDRVVFIGTQVLGPVPCPTASWDAPIDDRRVVIPDVISGDDVIAVAATGTMMSPRIEHGSVLFVRMGDRKADGVMVLVEQDGVVAPWGLRFQDAGWNLVTPSGTTIALTGEIKGIVLGIRVFGSGRAYSDYINPDGISIAGPL